MKTIHRRHFLKTTSTAAIAFGAVPLLRAKDPAKLRTALIGSGWWGMNLLNEAMASGRIEVVALCDVYDNALEVAADQVTDVSGDKPKRYKDYRELLAKEKVDVAIIATPDHWHALNAIEALKAGAHVFVEKPTGHTIMESGAMVRAAKASGNVVQVGLHRRIGPHHVEAMKFLREGNLGKIGMVRTFVHGGGGVELPRPNSDVPEGMDWEMYCGPAPLRPFNSRIHPGGFRNFLDFANGTLGDWGVHWLDQVLWWSEEKHPRRVFCSGGRPIAGEVVNDARGQTTDAPDSQVATFEFESFTATWEHRKFASNEAEKHRIGCYFYGEKGTLHLGWRDGWTFYPSGKEGTVIHRGHQLQEPDGHNIKLLWADFIRGIDTGSKPVCDAGIGHRATNMSLLGMLSYKLGRSVVWDGEKEEILGDPEASGLLRRDYRGPWEYPV